MNWTVRFTSKAAKQVKTLQKSHKDALALLVREMQLTGPVQGTWPNYSKLGADTHHCHLAHKWVACWRVVDKEIKLIEVYYAGSRENAPY